MGFREGTFEVKVISRDKRELKGQLLKLIALEKEKSTKKKGGGKKYPLAIGWGEEKKKRGEKEKGEALGSCKRKEKHKRTQSPPCPKKTPPKPNKVP